jgi:hypothetical protein
MRARVIFITLSLVAALGAAAVSAETLAEAAARERARRKGEQKVFTDEDLNKNKPTPTPTPAGGAAAATEAPPSGGTTGSNDEPTESVADQRPAWQQRAQAARDKIKAARKDVADKEAAATKALTPYQWPPTLTDNNAAKQAQEELAVAQTALADAEKALVDLETEARRAGVPAGWIRER